MNTSRARLRLSIAPLVQLTALSLSITTVVAVMIDYLRKLLDRFNEGVGRVGRTLRFDGMMNGLCLDSLEDDDNWRW